MFVNDKMEIQALLFDKNYWTTSQAREFMKKSGYIPIIKVHTTDKYQRC